jgi:hypothetical protein
MSKYTRKDITGLKVFKLTVTGFSRADGKVSYWNCLCECGNTKEIKYTHLSRGKIQSCGCLSKKYFHDLTGLKFNKLTINCLKNRMGAMFSLDLGWDGMRGEIYELSDEQLLHLQEVRNRKKEEEGNKPANGWD